MSKLGGVLASGAIVGALFAAFSVSSGSAAGIANRSPDCTPPVRVDLVYAGKRYRLERPESSWLRVGRRLGSAVVPGWFNGCYDWPCGFIQPRPGHCGPPPPPPPPTRDRSVRVFRLAGIRPSVAISGGGSSRQIYVAEDVCADAGAGEPALVRCLRQEGGASLERP